MIFIYMFLSGAASVMVARGAMWNASVFSAKGKTPYEEVKREYVRKVFNFTILFRGSPTLLLMSDGCKNISKLV
jgi:tRNA-dihydrouridine synthase